MHVEINSRYRFIVELRQEPDLSGAPLFSQEVEAGDLNELIAETYVNALLGERLLEEPDQLQCTIAPQWRAEPIVGNVEITMTATRGAAQVKIVQSFASGRWTRTAQTAAAELRADGVVAHDDVLYLMLLALPVSNSCPWPMQLQSPLIVEQSLGECGVRGLAAGSLVPDRPVLINHRMAKDAVLRCKHAGSQEAGAAVLGKIVRLPEPLAGTTTRLVTVLSALIEDDRHKGATLEFAFSPDALAAATEIATLREMQESVQTVYHSHGWSPECAGCQRNGTCPLAGATPSLQDYALLESLLSSKATLMPIAGRGAGPQKQEPVLRVFAWQGGELHPIRWQTYLD